MESQLGGNVHLGTFLPLILLCYASSEKEHSSLGEGASIVLKETSYLDAIDVIKAIKLSKARVLGSRELGVRKDETLKVLG